VEEVNQMGKLNAWLLTLSLLCFSGLALRPDAPPDVVLFNGKIFTSNAKQPYVEALAIRGDRILATGSAANLKSLAGPQTKQIDLSGRTVIPGINDAHNHLELKPTNQVDVGMGENVDPSWSDAKAAIASAAQKSPANSLLVAEIGSSIFRDVSVNRDSLDKLAPANPLELVTFTGHAIILNSAGLKFFKIHEDQPDPLGGRFERDSNGRLTGVVREYATIDIERTMEDAVPDEAAVGQLRATLDEAAKWGITSIQDMSNGMAPARAVELLEKVPTPLRIRVMRMPITTPAGRDIQEGLGLPRNPTSMITVSGTKWMTDGVPIELTFTPRDKIKMPAAPPFDDAVTYLPLTFSEKEIAAMLKESLQNKDQLMLHISGYPAAKTVLDAMDATGGQAVWSSRRLRFEHGDGAYSDLVERIKTYGIVVVQNPSHFMALAGAGDSPFAKAQPVKSLLAAGIPVALGSDGPTNPFLNILFATLHANHPSEAITREQAVTAYTLTSAYAEFAEKQKGSLEAGKLADLAVLSQDIFTVPPPELPKTESVLTMVGGKVIYDAHALNTK
jgi:predicted amidohydrolase YtcJ